MSDLIKRRLDAYYYGFDSTDNDLVDKILGAVACAGKAVHHTDGWGEEMHPYDDHTGATPAEWIQNAANAAADALERMESTITHLADKLMDREWNDDMEAAPINGSPILTICRGSCSVRYWGEGEDGEDAWQPRIRGEFPEKWMLLPEGDE